MPLYTYKCKDCNHVFEVRQRMTDDPLDVCPDCAGEVRRVINSVGVVFKGKGFYVTDNRKATTIPSSSSEPAKSTTESTSEVSSTPEKKPAESKSVEQGT